MLGVFDISVTTVMVSPLRLLLIAGSTASGKSKLAYKLAKQEPSRIINADSMQLYRDLSILTARPTRAEMNDVPHALYGIWGRAVGSSVASWLRLADQEISQAWSAGQRAILVGGTGLYFKAFLGGIADIPDIPDAIRVRVRKVMRDEGAKGLHQRLADLAPGEALRLNPGDTQRLARALEVIYATGRPISDYYDVPGQSWSQRLKATNAQIEMKLLWPDRSLVYERCDSRVVKMVSAGVLQEVEKLMTMTGALDLADEHPLTKALGLREFHAHICGRTSLDEAIAATQLATRRYAKRQRTWFGRQMACWPRLTKPEG